MNIVTYQTFGHLTGVGHILEESSSADFNVEDESTNVLGSFFRNDRSRGQVDVVHRSGDIASGVHNSIGRHQTFGLACDAAAGIGQAHDHLLVAQIDIEVWRKKKPGKKPLKKLINR